MSAIYESDKTLSEYLLFHYGSPAEILTPGGCWPAGMADALDFAVRTTQHFTPRNVSRGLDLGCAVGRSTFEMSACCDEVVGIDFSHAFIRAADALREGKELPYQRCEEGNLATELVARHPQDAAASKVRFQQGDAMNLPNSLGSFDRVHAANLLCRLTDPQRLLDRLPSLVRPGGELVLATPCTWLAEFTPQENWPEADTLGWLTARLRSAFELKKQSDEPFLIRETARKFQWTSSLVTVWRRHD